MNEDVFERSTKQWHKKQIKKKSFVENKGADLSSGFVLDTAVFERASGAAWFSCVEASPGL